MKTNLCFVVVLVWRFVYRFVGLRAIEIARLCFLCFQKIRI